MFCRHSEYRAKHSTDESVQMEMPSFFNSSKSDKYSSAHSQQKAITAAIIEDLIIKCDMPISIVENVHFRHFCQSRTVVILMCLEPRGTGA